MGFYIQTGEKFGKGKWLENTLNAMRIPQPVSFAKVPKGYALVVVVHNPGFEAAGFAYNEREFLFMINPRVRDCREKEFFLLEWDLVCQLTGYKPKYTI